MTKAGTENILPYDSPEDKGTQVEKMFDSIAENYDKLNHTLSMGIDKGWRKKGIDSLKKNKPQRILDIATGTGDLAIQACRQMNPEQIVGVDISEGMMDVGRKKVASLDLSDKIMFERQDCMALTYEDNTFDAAMIAFGVRNFANLGQGLKEIRRVLKPGGELMILELTTPKHFPIKQGYWLYSRLFIPTVGRLISKDQSAYTYLPKTIEAFIQGKEMTNALLNAGFSEARYKSLTFGICTIYLAKK